MFSEKESEIRDLKSTVSQLKLTVGNMERHLEYSVQGRENIDKM